MVDSTRAPLEQAVDIYSQLLTFSAQPPMGAAIPPQAPAIDYDKATKLLADLPTGQGIWGTRAVNQAGDAKSTTTPQRLFKSVAKALNSPTFGEGGINASKTSVVASDTAVQIGKWGFLFPAGTELKIEVKSKIVDGLKVRTSTLYIKSPDGSGAGALYSLPPDEDDLPYGPYRLTSVVMKQTEQAGGQIVTVGSINVCRNNAKTNQADKQPLEGLQGICESLWGFFPGTDNRLSKMQESMGNGDALAVTHLLNYLVDRWNEGEKQSGHFGTIVKAYQTATKTGAQK